MTSKDPKCSLLKVEQPLKEKTISTRDDRMLDWVFLQRKEFPNRRFYFDDSIKIPMKKNMIGGIKMLGATVEPFYDVEKVTHIITTRLFKNENNENKEDEIKRCNTETVAVATHSLSKKHASTTAVSKVSTKRAFGTNLTNKNGIQNDNTKKKVKLDYSEITNSDKKMMGDIDLADAQRRGIRIWHIDKFNKIISRLLDTSSIDPPKVDHSFLQSSSSAVTKRAKNQIFSIIVGDNSNVRRPIISRQYMGEEHLISFHFDIPDYVSPFQTYSKKKSIQTKLSESLNVANSAAPPANAQADPTKDAKLSQQEITKGDRKKCEDEGKKRVVLPLKDESGYCEYCSVKYESLAQHRQSLPHVEFKQDSSVFKSLDDLIMEL